MSTILKPEDNIPSKSSSSTEWINWYKSLRKLLSKNDANTTFMKVWVQRGSNSANDSELRDYLEKQGIIIDKDAFDSISDLALAPFNLAYLASKWSLYIIIGFSVIILLIIVYALFNVAKNPEKIVSAAKFAI